MKDYIQKALRTESPIDTVISRISQNRDTNTPSLRLLHSIIGLITECKEWKEATDHVNAKEEIGDMFWYGALACDATGCNTEQFGPQTTTQSAAELVAELENICVVILDNLKARIFYNRTILKTGIEINQIFLEEVTKIPSVLFKLCAASEVDPEAVMDRNIEKLAARYKEKYTDIDANIRDLAAERVILEK